MLAPILAGVALLAAFVAWEQRSPHPIVDLALFSNRDFTIGTALSTVANFALFGLLFVMPQYFQDVGGSDPLGTGVRLLPMIGGMIVATRIGPVLVKRAGSRLVIIAGLALTAAALGLGATTGVETDYAFAALWITLLGAGIGLTMPAAMATAMGAVRSGVGAGIEVAQRLDSAALAATVRSAFVGGMDTVLLASAALTIVGAVIAVVYLPRRVAETPAPTPGAQAPVSEAAVAG